MVMFNVSRVPVRGALVSVLLALGGAFPAAAAVLDISYFDGGQKAQAHMLNRVPPLGNFIVTQTRDLGLTESQQ
jgi:hypothetical protein